MAQAFANFGTEVLLFESTHGLLPREDRDAAEIIGRTLRSDGVRLMCCSRSLTLANQGDRIRMTGDSHGNDFDEVVDRLLVSTGRVPNVAELGLDIVGVDFDDRSGIHVDDRLRTTNPRIFAAGDVCSAYKFTHAADFMARIVVQNALFLGCAKLSRLVIPWCTYTSPEIAACRPVSR